MKTLRTTSENPDFVALVKQLDVYLAEKDGDEHAFYAQYNHIDQLPHVVVIYEDDIAVGCGAIKAFDGKSMEVKRMFVLPACRGRGIASQVLQALENWAYELGQSHCVLETGKRQEEAVIFYERWGYERIPNYGQYRGMDNSICFEKALSNRSSQP